MKKIIILISCQIFLSIAGYSQQVSDSSYKNCVKNFYALLFKKNVTVGELSKVYHNGGINNEIEQMICDSTKKSFYDYKLIASKRYFITNSSPSFITTELKIYFYDLTQKLNLTSINKIIDSAKIFNQGGDFDDYMKLSFTNGKVVYFDLNSDTPTTIIGIYLNNGDLLEGKFYNNASEKLLLVGEINDPDGYVNIRKEPSINSTIVSKLINGNYFFYTPDYNSKWWLVRTKDNNPPLGYIYKNRIKNYIDFLKN